MIIRVPLIQGFNASEADIAAITDFAADRLQVSEIHFLPYHTLGMNKYQLLSQPYTAPDKPLDAPEAARLRAGLCAEQGANGDLTRITL